MEDNRQIKILGIAGSLRKNSYNKGLLEAAKQLVPQGAVLTIFEKIGEFPLYNQDNELNPPEVIKEFKQLIREYDAILFVSPEYNYSIPGVLKNAIDWASRPYGDSAWNDKPVAIMSATPTMLGGARMQYHLRQTFVWLNMHPVNTPEVIVTFAQEKFDKDGNLTDEHTKEKIKELLEALVTWTTRLTKFHK